MASESDRSVLDTIRSVSESVERQFRASRRVLSFADYLDLFAGDPIRYSRDASRYLRDVFDHFGTHSVTHPWGTRTRWRLFDRPWERAHDGELPRGSLVGQEFVQEEIYRALSNFVREGRPSRLVLLHGPNGSAKSTLVACLISALEHYSRLDDGALYCFNWVFPTSKLVRGAVGFGAQERKVESLDSFAHLPDDELDAKLLVEVRDHPLFLLPVEERERLLERLWGDEREPVPEWLRRGELSHKSQQVLEALLSSYEGSFADVLKHVRVERYFISQRYRVGAITIGPQMSVDAGERQITADRSLAALPPSLQAVTLYEAKGELVDAAGGILEFSDLLKRPLEAFKYLQLSVETNEVALTQQNIQLNVVMMGSANELHLDAFREHPEFASFRGRLELIRTPYLRTYAQERTIYDAHVVSNVARHVAPHSTLMAALFAVLTRMKKPDSDRYDSDLGPIVGSLTAIEKADLYAQGIVPDRLDADAQARLRASVADVYEEFDAFPLYEGRIGASPREMRVVLLDAAQSTRFRCLSPLAVIEEIEALCESKAEFEWLRQEPKEGGYHDVAGFTQVLESRLLDTWEIELYGSTGIVEESQYRDLFDRYVQHVSVWVKKERIRNKLTGQYEEPDAALMSEVERLLDVKGGADEFRKQMISTIAAWAIDHPGKPVDPTVVFPQHLKKMQDAILGERRPLVAQRAKDLEVLVRDDGIGLDMTRRRQAEQTLSDLIDRHGYCRDCAADAASALVRRRFADLV